MATQAELADHLGITQGAVSKLLLAGVLPVGKGRGLHDLAACRVAYLAHLREIAAGRAPAGSAVARSAHDLVAERARLAAEQADRIAMENAVRRGELVEISAVAAEVGANYAVVRTRLLAIPSETAERLARCNSAAEAHAIIEAAITFALEQLTNRRGKK